MAKKGNRGRKAIFTDEQKPILERLIKAVGRLARQVPSFDSRSRRVQD